MDAGRARAAANHRTRRGRARGERSRPEGRRGARSASDGSRCCGPSRGTRSTSCSPRSARRTRPPPRSTTCSRRARRSSRASTSRVLLPGFGSWSPPARHRRRRRACVRARDRPRDDRDGHRRRVRTAVPTSCTLIVPVEAVNVSAVHGIDPDGRIPHLRRRAHGGTGNDDRRHDVGAGDSRRAARGRSPDRGGVPRDARPCVHACTRAGPVRPSDRALPSRAPPARRRARRGGGARSRAHRGVGRAESA